MENYLLDQNIDFKNKVVLVRVDFNVPIHKVFDSFVIDDHTRIDETLPTLKEIIKKQPKLLILVSHLGRPQGKINPNLSLVQVKNYLSLRLNKKIKFIENYFPDKNITDNSGIILLENIRFLKDEENFKENNELSKYLSYNIDIYVNEAFSCSHRAHTSIVGINAEFKIPGKLMKKEINNLSIVTKSSSKKTLIIGGAKISDKIKLIENLLPSLNNIIIGGAMAFSFLKNEYNLKIGKTLYDNNSILFTKKITQLCKNNNIKIHLPTDWVVSTDINSDNVKNINNDIDDSLMGLDIGFESICYFNRVINKLPKDEIIIWNGPMGVFEKEQFSYGTEGITKTLMYKKDNMIIIGGGDSVSALNKFVSKEQIYNFKQKGNHISTGGGASLEFLEGKELPGIKFSQSNKT